MNLFSFLVHEAVNTTKQECITIGCVKPASVPVSPATHNPRPRSPAMHTSLSHMPPARHNSLLATHSPPAMHAPLPYPRPRMLSCGLTDACENITLPQTLWVVIS